MSNRKPENYYELIGDAFDEYMSAYDVDRRIALMRSMWPREVSGPMLEVGCGTGAVTRGLLDLTSDLVVTDVSAKLAERVGRSCGLEHQEADATQLPFESNTFGTVFSSECIEHTPNPKRAVQEMLRVCQPGGYVLITTPNRLWYPVVRLAQLTRLRKFQGNEVFLSIKNLVETAEEQGTVTDVAGCHLLPWQIPTAKRWLPYVDVHSRYLHRVMINIAICVRKEP